VGEGEEAIKGPGKKREVKKKLDNATAGQVEWDRANQLKPPKANGKQRGSPKHFANKITPKELRWLTIKKPDPSPTGLRPPCMTFQLFFGGFTV
jgi:hypothetical protein